MGLRLALQAVDDGTGPAETAAAAASLLSWSWADSAIICLDWLVNIYLLLIAGNIAAVRLVGELSAKPLLPALLRGELVSVLISDALLCARHHILIARIYGILRLYLR